MLRELTRAALEARETVKKINLPKLAACTVVDGISRYGLFITNQRTIITLYMTSFLRPPTRINLLMYARITDGCAGMGSAGDHCEATAWKIASFLQFNKFANVFHA